MTMRSTLTASWPIKVYSIEQPWDFRYNLSTLDLLLNCGPKSLETIARSAISQPLCVNS
jgi:hypothetical protein